MDPSFSAYALATSLKPSKAFAAAFAVMVLALAGCATGLGAEPEQHTSSNVARLAEGKVLASRTAGAGFDYTVRLISGELVSINEDSEVANGVPVLVEYSHGSMKLIPQNATIGY